jgi:hypothetical protein
VAVLAIFPVDEGGRSNDDAVVAGGGVVVKIDDWLARAVWYVSFEFFEKSKGGSFAAWVAAVLSWVDKLLFIGSVYLLLSFYTEDDVVVGFEEMDDSEAIDLVISSFLVDHDIYDSLPTSEWIPMNEAVVDYV